MQLQSVLSVSALPPTRQHRAPPCCQQQHLSSASEDMDTRGSWAQKSWWICQWGWRGWSHLVYPAININKMFKDSPEAKYHMSLWGLGVSSIRARVCRAQLVTRTRAEARATLWLPGHISGQDSASLRLDNKHGDGAVPIWHHPTEQRCFGDWRNYIFKLRLQPFT